MKHHGNHFFITGIDTDVGKTVVSSILVEAFEADYWKPIQSGDLHASDTMFVRSMVSNTRTVCHPERHRFTRPLSPHLAAKLEQKSISLDDFQLPRTEGSLIVEGAGGVLVPLNDRDWIIDIAKMFELKVILVTRNKLGSLNHTFAMVEALRARRISVAGLVFNGQGNPDLEQFVEKRCDVPIRLRIPYEENIDPSFITKQAELNRERLICELIENR